MSLMKIVALPLRLFIKLLEILTLNTVKISLMYYSIYEY
ncbi:MAG: hypothetical protein RJB18_1274 [Pseudomonadota bacterium]|jgi:hypothetical protein